MDASINDVRADLELVRFDLGNIKEHVTKIEEHLDKQNGRVFLNAELIKQLQTEIAVITERLGNLRHDYRKTETRAWELIRDNFLQIGILIALIGMIANWW